MIWYRRVVLSKQQPECVLAECVFSECVDGPFLQNDSILPSAGSAAAAVKANKRTLFDQTSGAAVDASTVKKQTVTGWLDSDSEDDSIGDLTAAMPDGATRQKTKSVGSTESKIELNPAFEGARGQHLLKLQQVRDL